MTAQPLAQPRFNALLLSGSSLIAILLAATGLYSLIATLVTQREHEIGVRRALGARHGHIRRFVLGRALVLTAAGTIAGLLLGLIAMRASRALLYDISPVDPAAIATAVVALTGTAALASWIPLRRALRVDAARALRAE